MKLFDSHCHLDDRSYEKDLDAVIKRAERAGVRAAMVVGTGEKSCARAIALAQKYANLYVSVGVHPHDVRGCSEALIESLRKLAEQPPVRAWGEIGLDFNRMYSPRMVQEHWFVKQLKIARELDLPVIIHERDSGGRLLDILKEHSAQDTGGVIHCFSGDERELKQYLRMGFYIGITGILTLKERGAKLRRLVRYIPEKKLVIETDAPYLTPTPDRNHYRRNEPAFVKSVLLRLARVREVAAEHLADVIWDNTCRLYRIDTASAVQK